ncbi:hypothetical protein LCGC14_0795440 [marine sediment metagenome]|uniref:Uncharacterized protein n=1 Tax=marine sediment metagenome TaxID=412755 RepID=A0A0F9PR67_9ZZZZ
MTTTHATSNGHDSLRRLADRYAARATYHRKRANRWALAMVACVVVGLVVLLW